MRTVLLLSLVASLSSCIADPSQLAQMSSMRLCDFVLNYPNAVYRGTYLEVLASRGEDCSQYLHLRNPEQNVNVDINRN